MNKPWAELPEKARKAILFGTGDEVITFKYDDGLREYKTRKPFEGVIPNLERRCKENEVLLGARGNRALPDRDPLRHLPRLSPQAGGAGGEDRGPPHRPGLGNVDPQGRCMDRRAARAPHRHAERDRRAHPERDPRAAEVPRGCRPRLPHARRATRHAVAAARASAFASPHRSAPGSRACSTCSTSRPSACTSATMRASSTRSVICAISATRCSSSSTTEAIMRRPITSIDIGPGAGHPRRSGRRRRHARRDRWRTRNRSPGDISPAARDRDARDRRPPHQARRSGDRGARANNLKNIDAEIPLGLFTCVTGVCGQRQVLAADRHDLQAVARKLNGARRHRRSTTASTGSNGSTRSSTSTSADRQHAALQPRHLHRRRSTLIRELFAALPEAKVRGYRPRRFSFNVPGGRCEDCEGNGAARSRCTSCPTCGSSATPATASATTAKRSQSIFKGKSIADVLEMTVGEAVELFDRHPRSIREMLQTLCDVGLDYLTLGQPATTLSGGEAQRVKLAAELARARHRPHALHSRRADHRPALRRHRQAARGAQRAGRPGQHGRRHRAQSRRHQDGRLDHRPRPRRRRRAAARSSPQGTPEQIVKEKRSYTGAFLKPVLAKARRSREGRGGKMEAAE